MQAYTDTCMQPMAEIVLACCTPEACQSVFPWPLWSVTVLSPVLWLPFVLLIAFCLSVSELARYIGLQIDVKSIVNRLRKVATGNVHVYWHREMKTDGILTTTWL